MSKEAMNLALKALREIEALPGVSSANLYARHAIKAIEALAEQLVPVHDLGWLELLRKNKTATDEVIGAFLRGHAEYLTGEAFVLSNQTARQPAQHPKAKAIAECLAVLRPAVEGRFPHEQALEELVGYIAAPQPAHDAAIKTLPRR